MGKSDVTWFFRGQIAIKSTDKRNHGRVYLFWAMEKVELFISQLLMEN